MIDVEQAFNPETKSVHVVFQSPGIGYYIPLYQREYSWDKDNIEQLLFDISKGLENIIDSNPEEIRFLGTLITVAEPNKGDIKPQDPKGLPTSIEKVIDGQQRISTISLFATLLHDKFKTEISDKLSKENEIYDEVCEVCTGWMDKLKDIYSFDLKRGKPSYKPKIIRGNVDAWTKDGEIDSFYKSDVSSYLARYIDYAHNNSCIPTLKDKSSKVNKNLNRINKWLIDIVLKSHLEEELGFPSSKMIINSLDQEHIWSYDREILKEIIITGNTNSIEFDIVSKLIQLSSVCHYLLHRCCFTIIQPRSDDWAFDLFQSLNATGTPLTAIEVFHPLVVNHLESKDGYKGSKQSIYFKKIESLFSKTTTAAQKSKRTNDFLTSFATAFSGEKLSTHFSAQKKWLEKNYTDFKDDVAKENFISFMGNYAEFYNKFWINNNKDSDISISKETLAKLSFLIESNHKMSITVLGLFYNKELQNKSNFSEFSKVVDLITSFYVIWRSSSSNSGLDTVYRNFFKQDKKDTRNISHCWLVNKDISYDSLNCYFKEKLIEKDIFSYDSWFAKSIHKLNYKDARNICRFTLFTYFNNTINDDKNVGLLKPSKKGTNSFLSIENWNSIYYKTLEHVAPQNNNNNWDINLYKEDCLFNSIGNLTLLPISINSMISNNSWENKLKVFKIIGDKDFDKIESLVNSYDISIVEKDKLLKLNDLECIESISSLTKTSINWNVDFVNKRTSNILQILWERMNVIFNN